MGRPQSFDTATVVQAARDVFWDKGLDATSLPDLEHATGLGRSSLYHAFSSKRGLFDAAVQDYLDTVVRPRLSVLTTEPTAPDAILTYLTGLSGAIAALPADSPRRGCLLLAGHDPALREVVDAYRRELTDAMRGGVAARRPGTDAAVLDDRARQVVAHVVTALVLARVDADASVATLGTATVLVRSWDDLG
jgi:AcrR family transcriptional regulator